MKNNRLAWIWSVLILLAISVQILQAQTNRGGISGTVTDPNGGGIPGAKVTVTNAGTNQATTLTTSDEGNFNAAQLEPVLYNISVEAAGFKKTVINNVKVDTSTVSTVTIKLELGTIENTVTITADDITINAENGTVGQTITERQVTDIPLNERNVLNLLPTLPNISGEVGSDIAYATNEDPPNVPAPGSGLSVGGGRPGQTNFLADGVSNTGASTGRAMTSFTPDTVQELNVQTSAFSAEYGQSLGGIVNITTKSGTNKFHGTAYYFKKDPRWAANPYSIISNPALRPVARTRQTEYGFTVGGPIYLPSFGEGGPTIYNGKDRSFFFFAYEPRQTIDTATQYFLFPTANMRAGNFSNTVLINGLPVDRTQLNALVASGVPAPVTTDSTIYQQFVLSGNQLIRCPFPGASTTVYPTPVPGCPGIIGTGATATFTPFAGNILPSSFFDPVAVDLLKYVPLPTSDLFVAPNGSIANWAGNRSAVSDDNRFQFRLDHQITANNKIFGRYSHIPIQSNRYVTVPAGEYEPLDQVNSLVADRQAVDQYLISDTHIFTSTLVNELRLGFTKGNFSRVNPPRWQTEGFAQIYGLPSITEANLPTFVGLTNGFPIGNQRLTLLGNEVDSSYQISDTMTWIRGNQSWKFGVDLRQRRLKTEPIGRAAGGQYDFSSNATNSRGLAGGTQNGGNALAGFLMGVTSNYQYRPAVMAYYYQWGNYAAFVQNDWKVTPNLTLNLGLRYALNTPRTEKYDRQGNFMIDEAFDVTLTDAQRRTLATRYGYLTTEPIGSDVPTSTKVVPFGFSGRGGRSRYLLPIDWNGWEPRFGFAYVPKWGFIENIFGEGKLVLRGGYGLTHSSLNGLGSAPSPDFVGNAAANVRSDQVPNSVANQQGTGQCNTSFTVRLSSNPPCINALSVDQIMGSIPQDGIVRDTNTLFRFGPTFIVSPNFKVPRSETWNLTAAWEIKRGTVLELSYTGNRGSNLFLSGRNLNAPPIERLNAILDRGNVPYTNIITSNVSDILGRTNVAGSAQNVLQFTQYGDYSGFNPLLELFDSSGYSIRHAGSAYLKSRLTKGLSITAAYTWAKSIDVGSDAGSTAAPNIFAARSEGYYRYGRPLEEDRAVSLFDVPHTFAATFVWDLPVGKGGHFFKNAGYFSNMLLGGWTLSGTARITSGYPFAAFYGGGNGFDIASSYNNRFDINPDPNISFYNPRYSESCPTGQTCEPYFNPAKFIFPAFGTLGNSPRSLGNIRGPVQEYFDLSLQKNFYPFGKDNSKRFQIRVDAINVLNHPNYLMNSTGGFNNFLAARGTNPSAIVNYSSAITSAEYDAWVAADPTRANLARSADGGATFNQVVALFNNNRRTNSAGQVINLLPDNFFSIPIPEGIATRTLNSFDIRTLEGFKQYRIKQVLNTQFGTLTTRDQDARKLQLTLKFFF
jgi:hypothetical protein